MGALFFEEGVEKDLSMNIQKLMKADINVWILSGDKKENVISLAKSLDVINDKMNLLNLQSNDIEDIDIHLNLYLNQFANQSKQTNNILILF